MTLDYVNPGSPKISKDHECHESWSFHVCFVAVGFVLCQTSWLFRNIPEHPRKVGKPREAKQVTMTIQDIPVILILLARVSI